MLFKNQKFWGFPGGAVVKNLSANAGDTVPRVRALAWEDPTFRGATKPVHHNYWACTLEPVSHNYWARVSQLLSLRSRAREPQLLSPHVTTTEPACLEPMLHNKRSHRNEKPSHLNEE